tara:strand:+ start:521 stop:631 length:111 start_codon:yes stop_codon:yes gene_type:complete
MGWFSDYNGGDDWWKGLLAVFTIVTVVGLLMFFGAE